MSHQQLLVQRAREVSAWFWRGAAHQRNHYGMLTHAAPGLALDLTSSLPHTHPFIEQVLSAFDRESHMRRG